MTSQVVEGALLNKGGYGRFRGQCVNDRPATMKEVINCKHNDKCLNFYFSVIKKQISSSFPWYGLLFPTIFVI